ncbi:xylulokinase [Desmospora activa]|uniref:Xylulose kinase n=1 Tax=Desmospora activa DSM 45169 TaxID=1121389 RepID=A0A2T4Z3W6_9BACL|nr:xylulokinase [Desmospora activa]PTM56578.1 xylulokinase [Desmospora activa DSM 45169]
MRYVIGVDLGTSAVKCLLVSEGGEVVASASRPFDSMRIRSGYSEQDPEQWVQETVHCLQAVMAAAGVEASSVDGISFSGQMHGLVLLDEQQRLLRPAILWNDTRTSAECREIEATVGWEHLLAIAKNPALEGFTLPKLLWVRKHEPHLYDRAAVFLLPKDYVRFRLTGNIHAEFSDAAGTLLLDIPRREWSRELCDALAIDRGICPPLVESHACVGTLLPSIAEATGLTPSTPVFAGGADNACGAIGASVLEEDRTLCSIGTSGVILSPDRRERDVTGKLHYFNHAVPGIDYAMGVTLAAGQSLSWLRKLIAPSQSYDSLLAPIDSISPGAGGLLFTPYLSGERTPHADADIRGSFIGLDVSHSQAHMVRSVVEGITFSLCESLAILRAQGKSVDRIVSIGGGAQSETWLQIQADIFNAEMVSLRHEEGPGMGAAMLAAVGAGWFDRLDECAAVFVKWGRTFDPHPSRVEEYRQLFALYKEVYQQTESLSCRLKRFRDAERIQSV